jgi:hypothetical protein
VQRAARFRRFSRDDEWLRETPAGFRFLAFIVPMLKRFVALMVQSA